MTKVILVICDGLSDRPIKELGDKTPLEAARTPNLDALAKKGITGISDSIGVGIRPGSDTSHLAILGYDPSKFYPGRGPIEAAGVGIELKHGDVAMRGNLATVDKNLIIKDRRAGRIEDTSPFCKKLNGIKIDGIEFVLKPGTAHRCGVIMRGRGLSDKITYNDPHVEGQKVLRIEPTDKSKEAKFTAGILNKFLDKAYEILKEMPENKAREKKGLLPANILLVRGAGSYHTLQPFEEKHRLKAACIAGGGLYKGIARLVGMDLIEVKGATGLPTTDIEAKFRAARLALNKYDFVFVHIKAADNLAEDGNFVGKKEFIERIDLALPILTDLGDCLIVISADHTTSSELKMHTGDPVPILMVGPSVRVDDVASFGERSCAKGGLCRIKGLDVMNEILNLIGKAELVGA